MAPFKWLRHGFADLMRAPRESLAYGLVMASVIVAVSMVAWAYGTHLLMLAMLCGFVFLAPLTCIGLYAISAQLERDQPVSLARSLRAAFKRYLGNEMVFALSILYLLIPLGLVLLCAAIAPALSVAAACAARPWRR